MSAVISGVEGWADIKTFWGPAISHGCDNTCRLSKVFQSDDTIARIIRRLSPVQLNDIFINFVNQVRFSTRCRADSH